MRTETRRILVNSSLSMSFRAHCIAGAGTELLRRARTELHPCLHPEASARSAATSRLELAALLRAVRDLRLGGRPRDARSTPVLAGLAVGTGATKKDGVRAKRRLQGRTRRSRRANASCKHTSVPSTSAHRTLCTYECRSQCLAAVREREDKHSLHREPVVHGTRRLKLRRVLKRGKGPAGLG